MSKIIKNNQDEDEEIVFNYTISYHLKKSEILEVLNKEDLITNIYITHKINYMRKQSLSITVSGIELTQ